MKKNGNARQKILYCPEYLNIQDYVKIDDKLKDNKKKNSRRGGSRK